MTSRSTQDSYWLLDPFDTLASTQNGVSTYSVLAAGETVRAKIAALQTLPGRDASRLFWSYPFDLTHLDASAIPAISQQTSDLPFQISNALGQISGVEFAQPEGSLFATLGSTNRRTSDCNHLPAAPDPCYHPPPGRNDVGYAG